MIGREQVRMARAALRWSVRDLAAKTGVTANTVNRYENGADAFGSTLLKIETAFKDAGIIFIDENGGGPGVRLKESLTK